MALLSVANRKKYMKALGYEYTEEGIRKLQKKYFTRSKDIDGKYGKNTDILVKHCYNVKMYAPHFKPQEFRCGCKGKYCTGYPTYMRKEMLVLLEAIRVHYGKPITITCGLRCKKHNKALNGSVKNSKHLKGKAADFYQKGTTDTLANRKESIKWIKKQPHFGYSYGNGVNSYGNKIGAPYMGNALHVDAEV